jgi:hypothetical protein
MDAADIFPWLIAFFNARYQSQADKSLIDLYTGHRELLEWDSDQLEAFYRLRKTVFVWFEKPGHAEQLAAYLAEMTLAFTPQRTSSLTFTQDHVRRLRHIYGQAIGETVHLLHTAEPRTWQPAYRMLLKCHFVRLQAILASLLPRPKTGEAARWFYRDAMASEYSAEWQMKILGINTTTLKTPVLDVGCGTKAHLVFYFKTKGLEACGVDRFAESQPGLIKSDWFQFRFDPGLWSTVVSHLAFSNHFWFHHLNPRGEPEKYMEKYMEILGSLAPGGRFVYFPALPFVERFLPADQYSCQKIEVPSPAGIPPASDSALLYASHVVRLASEKSS